MKAKNLIFIFCIFFFLCSSLFADERTSTQKVILDNGMVVLVRPMVFSPKIAIHAYVKVGSATEGKYLGAGIAHLVEHMLFKGTGKRTVGQIAQEVKALGGSINASTSRDYTIYTLDLPVGHFDEGLDIIADMLMHARFTPEEFDKEKKVILKEMKLREDDPSAILSKLAYQTIYKQHPYRHPIIGHKPLFEALTLSDLEDFYRHYYVPNNMILSIAGNVTASDILSSIKEAFEDFKPRPYILRNLPPEHPQGGSRRVEEEYPTVLTRVMMAFRGVHVKDPDMFALDVLAMLLGEGKTSRLHQDLFEKKRLVYSISAVNFTPIDQGFFRITFSLEEKDIDKAITSIWRQIELIQSRGVSVKELEKAKRGVLSDYIFNRQTASSIAYESAISEDFVGDFDFSKKYVDGIRKVGVKDIQRVAKKYLIMPALSTIILKPNKEKEESKEKETSIEDKDIEIFRLDNGIRILLKEDHTFPLVALQFVCQGGLRQETETNNGISQVIANLWTKGTKRQSYLKIAQSVEERGARLNGFAGKNSFGLTLEVLSEDLDFGLRLLEDLVKNPSFPEDQLSKIKQQLMVGIRAQQDDVFKVTSQKLLQLLFKTHPYRLNSLGTLESVSHIRRLDVERFFNRLVVPDNMVLAIYGDIDSDRVLSILEKKFSGIKKRNFSIESPGEKVPPEVREKTNYMDKEQAVVMFGFQGPSLGSDEQMGLEVLVSILGSSMNSRMFVKIREELGEAYTLGGRYTPGPDMGIIQFYVSTTDEKVGRVKELLKELIKEIQMQGVDGLELNDTKEYLKGRRKMALETNAQLAFMTSLDELYGLGFDYYQGFDKRVDRVTKKDIQRLARKYLDLKKASIVITRPSKKTKMKE